MKTAGPRTQTTAVLALAIPANMMMVLNFRLFSSTSQYLSSSVSRVCVTNGMGIFYRLFPLSPSIIKFTFVCSQTHSHFLLALRSIIYVLIKLTANCYFDRLIYSLPDADTALLVQPPKKHATGQVACA